MSNVHKVSITLLILLSTLSGCMPIGEKAMSMSTIYGVTTVLSFMLFVCYFILIKKRNSWYITLFACVFVVNIGYWALSTSSTLNGALFANRIAYLGAVILPLAMLMIIKNVCNINYHRLFIGLLISISIAVFLIAASPGYLDIYYKSAQLQITNGVSILVKEYGSWHILYLFYLLGYFAAMISTIVYALVAKKLKSTIQAVMLVVAVFVNISVWLLEQLVDINFEFLSVSYIVSEIFLLSQYFMIQETEKMLNNIKEQNKAANYEDINPNSSTNVVLVTSKTKSVQITQEQCEHFQNNICALTPTEKMIFNLHLECKSTKEILEELNIKENTLKYHNKNIYGKLGVCSKKQLREIANYLSISAQ